MEQGGASVVGFVVQILLARLLAPEVFGIVAILVVFTSLMDSIAQSGLGSSLIQKSDADDDSFSTALWLSLALAVALYGILFVTAPFISSFYQMGDMSAYLRVLGLMVLFNSFNSIQRSYLQRSLDFKTLFKANFAALLLSGLIGVGLAFFGFGVWALVGQYLAQSVCGCLALLVFVPWRPRFVFRGNEAKGLFRYGWKICVTGLLSTLYNGISELVIGKSCGSTALGYYSQGRKYPNLAIGVITTALSNVLFPAFARLKDDVNGLRGSMKVILAVGTFVIAPVSLMLCVIAHPLVLLLLTDKWLPSVLIFQLAFGVNAFLMFELVNLRAYMSLGDSGLYLRINIIKMVVGGIAICATAIITKDIYITAAVTAGTSVAGIFLVDLHSAKRVHGYAALAQIRDQLPTYCIAVIAAGAAYACSFISLNYIILMIIQIAVYGFVYLILSRFFNRRIWDLCWGSLLPTKS